MTNKTVSHNQIHSVPFYESLVQDLKSENDRLYSEISRIKTFHGKASSQVEESTSVNNEINERVADFWLREIKRKQATI